MTTLGYNRRMSRYLQSLPRFAHTSHRGGSLLAPENTLVAFRQAAQTWRTDVLELDVQLSRDGHVVVIHDETLDRTTSGQGPVAALTLEELRRLDAGFHQPAWRGKGAVIPTLQEVLTQFPRHHLNIELKIAGDALREAFSAVITQAGAVDRVCIGHVDAAEALQLRQRLPHCAYWCPEAPLLDFFQCSRGGDPLPPLPEFQVLSLPSEYMGYPVIDEKLVADAHGLGKAVHVWTVNDAALMDQLMSLGVDSIITDRPDLLRQRMDARGW